MNGVINIYKPKGMTSHDVVSRVRRILGTRRVGHTGTLDPDAEGVLPICVGLGTKAAELLTASEKEYRATLLLGMRTDTEDLSGTILEECPVTASPSEIEEAILSFVGEYDQIPPMYSALKKDGQKLYDLARQGITVEREARHISIHYIKIHSISGNEADFTVGCSKGTYIRTLCSDIGEKLGCGGTMATLLRTACGKWFTLENAVTLEELPEKIEESLTPLDTFFMDYPSLSLTEKESMRVKNGVPIYYKATEGETYRLYDSEGNFIALSKAVFNEENRLTLKLIKGFY